MKKHLVALALVAGSTFAAGTGSVSVAPEAQMGYMVGSGLGLSGRYLVATTVAGGVIGGAIGAAFGFRSMVAGAYYGAL